MEEGAGWQCQNCTLINAEVQNECDACGCTRISGQPIAAVARPGADEEAAATDQWQCEECTLFNADAAQICTMCDAPRPEVPFEVEVTRPDGSQYAVLVSGGKQPLGVLRHAVAQHLCLATSEVCLTTSSRSLRVDSRTLAECGITRDSNQIVASKRELHVARCLQEAVAPPTAQPLKGEVRTLLADWVEALLTCPKFAARRNEFAGDGRAEVEICEMLDREADGDREAANVNARFEQRAERLHQKIRTLLYSQQLRASADSAKMGSAAGYR